MPVQILAQVNLGRSYGTNLASLLGMLYVVLSIVYLTSRLNSSTNIRSSPQSLTLPIFILLCGFILIFNGWILNPILQFSQLLLFLVIAYLIYPHFSIR